MTSQPLRSAVRTALWRLVLLACLGLGLLAGSVILPRLHHVPPVPPAANWMTPEQQQAQARLAVFDKRVATLERRHDCHGPAWWTYPLTQGKPALLPHTMLVQLYTVDGRLPTYDVVVKPWSFDRIGGKVLALCDR